MENNQHIKTFNADSRSKNRLRYTSAKTRAKKASADVYRSYKRRIGVVTTAASREERVHNPDQYGSQRGEKPNPRKKRKTDDSGGGNKIRVLSKDELSGNQDDSDGGEDIELETGSTFSDELDLARNRNGSQTFSKLFFQISPLVGSLPEILHHAERITELLLSFMLSPASDFATPQSLSSLSPEEAAWKISLESKKRERFNVNLATTDILHLLSVLARDLRHEMHPFLHKWIIPRIVHDLINPPTSAATINQGDSDVVNMQKGVNKKKEQLVLDVTIVETAFRTLSYIFKYDATMLLSESSAKNSNAKKKKDDHCLEPMRKYYGATLAHKQEFVRRLASETFAPLIRKIRSKAGRKKHLRRVIRALASSVASSSSVNSTVTAKKARENAIDGVSRLLFAVVSGAPGRLHSKGKDVIQTVIDCVIDIDKQEGKKSRNMKKEASEVLSIVNNNDSSDIIYEVASQFTQYICSHCNCGQTFSVVWDILYQSMEKSVDSIVTATDDNDHHFNSNAVRGLGYVLQIINSCILYGNCRLLSSDTGSDGALELDDDHAERLSRILQRVLENKTGIIYENLGQDVQRHVLQLLCSSWKAYPDHPAFTSRFCDFFMTLANNQEMKNEGTDSGSEQIDPSLVLAKDLLPVIPGDLALQSLIPAILSSTAQKSRHGTADEFTLLSILHAVSTADLRQGTEKSDDSPLDENDKDDSDKLFFDGCEHSARCIIPAADKEELLKICMLDIPETGAGKSDFSRLSFVARCIPFLCYVESEEDVKEKSNDSFEKIYKWGFNALKVLEKVDVMNEENERKTDSRVTMAMLLESIAHIVLQQRKKVKTKKGILKILKQAKKIANKLLFENPSSIFVVKAASTLVKALEENDLQLSEKANDVFELLNPNLCSEMYFLRLHSLIILRSFPNRPYRTDHSELDLSDDLDEEPSQKPQLIETGEGVEGTQANGQQSKSDTSISGICDIMDTLLQIENIPVNLRNERRLTSAINRVEILGRTGKLPYVYAEAAANHMFGVMSTKFQPLWRATVKAVTALASTQPECVWPCLEAQLKLVMQAKLNNTFTSGLVHKENDFDEIQHHHELCCQWETSLGLEAAIFGERSHSAERDGRVSRHQRTDEMTKLQTVFSVLEGAPQLTATKSRIVVPIFLQFLYEQYFSFYDDDPDSREFGLEEQLASISDDSYRQWPRDQLGRKMLQTKLTAFLNIFSVVKGMQQLYKHKVLLVIFISFLSNPDLSISQLSLSCVIGFKLPYVTSYSEYLKDLTSTVKLRDALVKFQLSKDDGIVDVQHRVDLFPIVIRLLFGRLSARGNGHKSSKNSPAARRAIILSYLNGLSQDEKGMEYFMYMMVRAFIPQSVNMTLGESGHNSPEHIRCMIDQITEVQSRSTNSSFLKIPEQRQEGFLNLLSDVIKQIGFGVQRYIPVLIKLLIMIVNSAELTRKVATGDETLEEVEEEDMNGEDTNSQNRGGKIRNLCFRRMSELFLQFANTFDFTQFSESFWLSISPALQNLPISVIHAEKSPSLLVLMESISSHPKLLPLLLECEKAVELVIKCISPTSRFHTIDCTLKFVNNLLTEGDSVSIEEAITNRAITERPGLQLILKFIDLLIGQFTKRLEHGNDGGVDQAANQLAWRELSILCCVSKLLVFNDSITSENNDANTSMMESLCNLLTPFLNFGYSTRESSQNDVLDILCVILPKIRAPAALSHYHAVSKLLGPNKSSIGIETLEIRQRVVSCIEAMSSHDEVTTQLRPVAIALRDLSASDEKHVDEWDFDRILPILNGLGSSGSSNNSWLHFAENVKISSDIPHMQGAKILAPLIYSCLHLLYDADGILNRGAFKALHALIIASSEQSSLSQIDTKSEKSAWLNLIETLFIPMIRNGLKTKVWSVRRSFVRLLAEISKHFVSHKSPHLYGDLRVLTNDDDQEIDFFLNITHVQVHRRGRALTRLRKLLSNQSADSGKGGNDGASCPFSVQSLTNVLLPLAMRPIYESELKSEEGYVLEAIAAIGAISKHLPWGKYQNTLWTALLQLPRNEGQERYLIAMICSIVDAFHFNIGGAIDMEREIVPELESKTDLKEENIQDKDTAIWSQLKGRLIPKLESYLVKKNTGREKSTNLRSPIALAIVKLLKKLPKEIFVAKLPRILSVICDSLRNKDSNERDVARDTLSKIAESIDIKYLSDILRELAVTLKDGYMLFVRSACLHSVLLSVTNTYQPSDSTAEDEALSLPFDNCVPAMMDIIQQDIFGRASEMKEAEGVQKRVIKEAMGVKSYHSLEMIAQSILFKPSIFAAKSSASHMSGLDALVRPLLHRLREPEVQSSTIGKVKECMNKIVVGLSHNPSLQMNEALPFVYATVSPFILVKQSKKQIDDNDTGSDESDGEELSSLKVSKTGSRKKSTEKKQKDKPGRSKQIFEWTPSRLKNAKDEKSAKEMKMKERADRRKVQDGANAPKLTGKGRYDALTSSTRVLSDPASACAVSFGLNLLYSHLKRSKIYGNESLANPFIQILTECLRYSSDNNVIELSFKSLQILLRSNLPSVQHYRKKIGTYTLRLLTVPGTSINARNEIIQLCFKTLTLLFALDKKDAAKDQAQNKYQEEQGINEQTLPLTAPQMKVLVSILQASVTDSEHHNATFGLIKAITSTKYKSSEYYDLMDSILKLSVQSQKTTVRQHASQIFLMYFIEYPMGKERIENHLKQTILNIKYAYEDGRMTALNLVKMILQKLPIPILEEYTQLFFLPLVLQLVNDDSDKCRESVAECLSTLLKRLSSQLLQSLYDYVLRWFDGTSEETQMLRRTSTQLFGIFTDARLDFMKRGDKIDDLLTRLGKCLKEEVVSMEETNTLLDKEWEMCYFCLNTLEKLNKEVPNVVGKSTVMLKNCVNLLIHPHPWVRLASSRIIQCNLSDATLKDKTSFLVEFPGCLFDIARNLCYQLNATEDAQVQTVSDLAIKNLSYVIRAMNSNPDLCYQNGEKLLTEEHEDGDDDDDSDSGNNQQKGSDPILWLMTRLSNIAKQRGSLRRDAVFKCFAAFATVCEKSTITSHLALMLEPINRVIVEADNKKEVVHGRSFNGRKREHQDNAAETSEADLAREVMQLLEDKCGTEEFVNVFAIVKTKAREKREQRKQRIATEAVHDPVAAAKRKIWKQQREKSRRKRRVDERKNARGVFKKTRHGL